MDLIYALPVSSRKLHFEIDEIDGGWMTIVFDLSFPNEFSYDISYVQDPINEMLEQFVAVLKRLPHPGAFEGDVRISMLLCHNREAEGCMHWAIVDAPSGGTWLVILENAYLDLEILYPSFSTIEIERHYEDVPDFRNKVRYAARTSWFELATSLKIAIDNLRSRPEYPENKERWGYRIDTALYNQLCVELNRLQK